MDFVQPVFIPSPSRLSNTVERKKEPPFYFFSFFLGKETHFFFFLLHPPFEKLFLWLLIMSLLLSSQSSRTRWSERSCPIVHRYTQATESHTMTAKSDKSASSKTSRMEKRRVNHKASPILFVWFVSSLSSDWDVIHYLFFIIADE